MTVTDSATQRYRIITTPEGLPLSFNIALLGSRIAAILIDLFIMAVAVILIYFFFILVASLFFADAKNIILSICMLASFFIFNGYFLFFELKWRGATPGKRAVNLRVVSRNGGPLTTGAVFARNLMRDLELFLPAQALLAPEALYGSAPGWALFLVIIWILIFLFMPMFNTDRARCGDLIAGTIVVEKPEGKLLPDIAENRSTKIDELDVKYIFNDKQLDMYGIKELQVLEEVIRMHSRKRKTTKAIHTVCTKIMQKIGWSSSITRKDEVDFLKAFYKAQRHRLEHGLLLGKRREHKRKGRLVKKKPESDIEE